MLTFNNLSYIIKDKVIFKNISFSMLEASILCIKGAKNSGKTILLKIIAGLASFPNNESAILWNNQNIRGFYQKYLTSITYIGNKTCVRSELTVEENIYFLAKLHGTEMLMEATINHFSLNAYRKEKCSNLAPNIIKKVTLSVLCACPTSIWLLDDPFTMLDKDSQILLMNLISIRASDGGIVIITTNQDQKMKLLNSSTLNLELYK